MQKLGGIGLTNMVIVAMFTVFFIVAMKAVLTMYQIDGLSEFFQAA